jgi:hypothetical protein
MRLLCATAAAIDALDTWLSESGSTVPPALQDVLPLVGRLLDTRNLSSVDVDASDKVRPCSIACCVCWSAADLRVWC